MFDETPKRENRPRVFVSSVMAGYLDVREVAREAIAAAGCEPVLIEDFPALRVSPRTACLDAVETCDAYVGILGQRAGYIAPSGMTVVQEEFEEARRLGLPSLILLEDVEMEAEQERVARKLSDFVSGRFRKTFASSDQLRRHLIDGIGSLDLGESESVTQAAESVSRMLEAPALLGDRQPYLRLAIAPTRVEEVVDPRDFESTASRLLKIGHGDDLPLLSYEVGYESHISAQGVRIYPKRGRHRADRRGWAALELTGRGQIVVDSSVTGLAAASHTQIGLGGIVILIGDVERQLKGNFGFVRQAYDALDPHDRHHTFVYEVKLEGIRHRALLEAMPTSGSVPMPIGNTDSVSAHEDPRTLSRSSLRNPEDELERILVQLKRRSDSRGW